MANDNPLDINPDGGNGDPVDAQTTNKSNGVRTIHAVPSKQPRRLPSYKSIPSVPGMPHGCAWGLWDTPGHKDDLGTLNLLTPDVILSAREEIQVGISVAINWPLNNCATPHSHRKPPEHHIKALRDWAGFDDEISMNTQSGSQWDGFRHWAHQPTGLFYNGVTHADISAPDSSMRNGIDKWTQNGGIVGRAILLDYLSYAQAHNITYDPTTRHAITHTDLEAVAASQGTEFRPGDILLVRSGFVKWYNEASFEERRRGTELGSEWAGLEGTRESVEWLWEKHFAAVGGDANVFEAWPAADERYRPSAPYLNISLTSPIRIYPPVINENPHIWADFSICIGLHDVLLALWGTPIGEMFNLEELAETCRKHRKWSCFFTSAPLNFPGGIASPPNAICVL